MFYAHLACSVLYVHFTGTWHDRQILLSCEYSIYHTDKCVPVCVSIRLNYWITFRTNGAIVVCAWNLLQRGIHQILEQLKGSFSMNNQKSSIEWVVWDFSSWKRHNPRLTEKLCSSERGIFEDGPILSIKIQNEGSNRKIKQYRKNTIVMFFEHLLGSIFIMLGNKFLKINLCQKYLTFPPTCSCSLFNKIINCSLVLE